jgi:hypothetical protein
LKENSRLGHKNSNQNRGTQKAAAWERKNDFRKNIWKQQVLVKKFS